MRGLTAFLVLLLATAAIAGCGSPAPPAIDGAFPRQGDVAQLPFRVVDASGLIGAVSIVNPDSTIEGIRQVDGRADAVDVQWPGGMCDKQVQLVLSRTAGGLSIEVSTQRDFGGCRMAAIMRAIRIEFREPVDASTLVLVLGE